MIAANKLSADADVKVFDDIPALQRKWQAAVRPGQILPGYEEVMFGSLAEWQIISCCCNRVATATLCLAAVAMRSNGWGQPMGHSAPPTCPPDCALAH